MKLTDDESRALAFITGLLLLSLAVRVAAAPEVAAPVGAGELDLAGHIEAAGAAAAEAARRELPLGEGERIDPNRAGAVELDRLPRVGASLAARIVADREENGPFRSLEDLGRVRGIGGRVLEEIAPHLALPRGSRAPAAAGGAAAAAERPRTPWRPRILEVPGEPSDAEARREGIEAEASRGPEARVAPVDLNTADAATLETLPGIGPALAARIVAHRDSAGPFPDLEALGAVRGIGPATLARLRDRVRVR